MSLENKARVVHLTTVHRLGDPRIFYKEIPSLQSAGYEVSLVAQHPRNEVLDGVSVVGLTPTSGRFTRLLLWKEVLTKVKKLRPEVLHFHDPELIPLVLWMKKRRGYKVVYDIHEDYFVKNNFPENVLVRALEKKGFKEFDALIIANPSYRSFLNDYAHKVYLVDNYPIRQAKKSVKKIEEPVRLIYTGVLGLKRGLNFLVSLAHEVSRQKLPWKIVWAGMCINSAEREAVAPQLSEVLKAGTLELHGWDTYLPHSKVEEQVGLAHIGLCLMEPHEWWPIPTKFFEYAIEGLPLICTDITTWREWVETNDLGKTVRYGDTAAVIRQVQDWLDHPAAFEKASQNALVTGEKYGWATAEKVLLSAYQRLEK